MSERGKSGKKTKKSKAVSGKEASGKGPAGKEAAAARSGFFGFDLGNLLVVTVAVLTIVLGYYLLDQGSVTAAPTLLVVGYVILLPAAILWGYGRISD